MLYHIKGLHRETGEPFDSNIEALDKDDAINKASDLGIVVEKVRQVILKDKIKAFWSLLSWTIITLFTPLWWVVVYRTIVVCCLVYIGVLLSLLYQDNQTVKPVWVKGGSVDVEVNNGSWNAIPVKVGNAVDVIVDNKSWNAIPVKVGNTVNADLVGTPEVIVVNTIDVDVKETIDVEVKNKSFDPIPVDVRNTVDVQGNVSTY